MGIVADFALIECPSWEVSVAAGELEPVRSETPPMRSTLHPLCLRCGKLIDVTREEGCPAILSPVESLTRLLRIVTPTSELHAEA